MFDLINSGSRSRLQYRALVKTVTTLMQVTYASLARKHGLSASAQEWLARVHTIPSVPLADCHKKLKEQIKVHLLPPASQQDLLAALDVIEGTSRYWVASLPTV